MRKPITLSGKNDPDLMALYERLGKKEFIKMIKDSLRCLVRAGYRNEVNIPISFKDGDGNVLPKADKTKRIQVGLTFSDKKDADVTYLLDQVEKGMGGLFIKQAIRFHVGSLLILPAFLSNGFCENLRTQSPIQVLFANEGEIPIGRGYVRRERRIHTEEELPREEKRTIPQKEEKTYPKEEEKKEPSFTLTGIPSFGMEEPKIPKDEGIKPSTEDDEDEMLSLLDGLLGD